MCGFLGQFSSDIIDEKLLKNSNNYLICRGPDDLQISVGQISKKFSTDNQDYYSFIFNRLTILDLTDHSKQPMFSDVFNTSVMFNGEIYNHNELRKNLESKGVQFKSDHSDTEVVLNGLSFYGISFVNQLVGQFAISFFNAQKNELTLIRDRLGQKPLFFHHNKTKISFGSNLKSLIALEGDYELDESSFNEYLNCGVVTSPKTIFKDFYKVQPSEVITFELDENYKIKNKFIYWDPKSYIDDRKYDQDEFINLFSTAVNCREKADVEIATFLSGGIDSTSILKNLYDRKSKINSFSAIYDDKKYDEKKWSDDVSKKYSNKHNSKIITNKEIANSIYDSIEIFDEPYADPSTVPSYLLSKAISEDYKVAISGDGGDELLGGYDRISFLMDPSRKRLNLLSHINKIYPNHFGTGTKFRRYSSNLSSAIESFFTDPNLLSLMNRNYMSDFNKKFFINTGDDYKSILLTEYKFYLSEMMMLKIDRTSMSNSLEIRSPFVDHRLIEYMMSVSSKSYNFKFPKAQLKNYLSNDFSQDFTNRKKMGFVFNVEKWVFDNYSLISSVILKNIPDVNIVNLNKLNINRSRTNGFRLWKLFFIAHYLASLSNSR